MTELQDLLSDELLETRRIVVEQVFEFARGNPSSQNKPDGRTKSPVPSKDLIQFFDLLRQSIDNLESRLSVQTSNKIIFTEEEPDINSQTETIVFSVLKREPGAFSEGPPFAGKVRNLRPMLREELIDSENPGYRKAIAGYYYDNLVRLTCWARTNKEANARSAWLEDLMEEYSWWFKLQGVERVIFWGRDADLVTQIDNNKWYGRPMDYYIRTEKIKVFSEKTIEDILVKLLVSSD